MQVRRENNKMKKEGEKRRGRTESKKIFATWKGASEKGRLRL